MAKMARILPMLVIIAVSCICAAGIRADEPKKSPPTKDQIAQWIRDLGDNESGRKSRKAQQASEKN